MKFEFQFLCLHPKWRFGFTARHCLEWTCSAEIEWSDVVDLGSAFRSKPIQELLSTGLTVRFEWALGWYDPKTHRSCRSCRSLCGSLEHYRCWELLFLVKKHRPFQCCTETEAVSWGRGALAQEPKDFYQYCFGQSSSNHCLSSCHSTWHRAVWCCLFRLSSHSQAEYPHGLYLQSEVQAKPRSGSGACTISRSPRSTTITGVYSWRLSVFRSIGYLFFEIVVCVFKSHVTRIEVLAVGIVYLVVAA